MGGASSNSRVARSQQTPQKDDFNGDSPRKRIRYNAADTENVAPSTEAPSTRPTVRRGRPPLNRANTSAGPSSVRSRRAAPAETPRFDSAAAAAAAATGVVDGYKPREERSWEEFHPDLEIESPLQPFTADDVDGIVRATLQGDPVGSVSPLHTSPGRAIAAIAATNGPSAYLEPAPITPQKKRGRPPRRPDSILHGLGSPPGPRITPIPAQNPRERLNLPKPSYRRVETFKPFEEERENQVNYVDKGMANVGYQESEMFVHAEKGFVRLMQDSREEDRDLGLPLKADGETKERVSAPTVTRVEYDMDEQDERWLEALNLQRKGEQIEHIKPAIFEITMTQIEKEWHALEKRIPKPNPKPPQTQRPRSSSAAAVNGETAGAGEEQDSKCAICDEGDCENTNAIVFCDGCDLAVHQECYGIPFIPEGQWLCRKCQTVGRATPACLFCPNTEGAFKMTHESRWAHLLCAIWIKEVSLGNTTFMEPIMDVASVPTSRWKLLCYICNQPMGAAIQCQHASCYRAYHVTCARRAKLYLSMKVGGSLVLDAGSQVSYCDKHVPSTWREEHDTDRAILVAQSYYRRTMKGRRWASSQQSALALLPSNILQQGDPYEDAPVLDDAQNAAGAKKKQLQAQKNIWRLPSGAPIVPQVVFDAVEMALARFTLRKRKEYVAEACKYWSLKREARRGAALLKRLQLQMETFSASEITRRDFTAMGPAGRARLQRRIELAERLLEQMEAIHELCKNVRTREELKLQDAETLKDIIDTVYFPINALLRPIIEKAIQLVDSSPVKLPPSRKPSLHFSSNDTNSAFTDRLIKIQLKIDVRDYTSVNSFARDMFDVFRAVPGLEAVSSLTDAYQALEPRDFNLNAEQKETRKLAKRILKAVHPLLTDALGKESELGGKSPEKGGLDLNKADSVEAGTKMVAERDEEMDEPQAVHGEGEERAFLQAVDSDSPQQTNGRLTPKPSHSPDLDALPSMDRKDHEDGHDEAQAQANGTQRQNFPTPTPSELGVLNAFTQGGVPWYLETFDPCGTEIHDERESGGEGLKALSEELSEIDDEELKGLGPASQDAEPANAGVTERSVKKSPPKQKRRSMRGLK